MASNITAMEQFKTLDEFYDGAEILVTGATGFMGKILVEKLLRQFPRIKNIYLIVREKKGESPAQRVDKLFETVIFEQLKYDMPHFNLKIKVITGQLEAHNFGLRPEDKKLLTSKVNIIFHCAATLRFDEELKVAINTNMCATQRMLELAKQCPNLRMFTYVSTAFSNANRRDIDEIIYKPQTHYSELLKLAQLDIEDPKYQEASKRLAQENINTYTLTKAAAEQLLREEGQHFPVCIYRPSIVVSTWNDPIPGWIDNLYGPTGLVTGVQAGVIRSVLADPEKKADMVPVDYASNALIVTPWSALQKFQKDNTVLPIYNYISSKDNPITWNEFAMKSMKIGIGIPSSQVLWPYLLFMTKHKPLHHLRCLVLHYLFGYIFDLCSYLTGNTFRLVRIYSKMDKVVSALEPFSKQEWKFDNSSVLAMWSSLSPMDRVRFPFNITDLDWDDYLEKYVRGTLVHHLKDKLDPSTRQKALKRYKRLLIAHNCVKVLLYVFLSLGVWSLLKYLFSV